MSGMTKSSFFLFHSLAMVYLLWLGIVIIGLWVAFGVAARRKKVPPGPSMNIFRKLHTFLHMFKGGKLPHTLSEWHKKHGQIVYFGVSLGPLYRNLMYSVADPILAKEILRKTSIFPARWKAGLTHFIPKSLLGIHENNEMWKKHRTILSKAFTDNYLRQYSKEIVIVSDELLTELQGCNVIENINKKMADITYRIVACTVLGKDFYSAYPTVGTKSQVSAMLKSIMIMTISPPPLRRFATHISSSVAIANDFMSAQKNQIWSDIENIRTKSLQGNSMLHFLVHHAADLSNDEIIDELLAFIMAGHETTANALSFALVCLACNAHTQKKAREEIIIACDGSPISFQSICKLPYVRAVLKETLRLFPVVPITSRAAVQSTKLGPYSIDPGDRIMINIYEICRDPAVFTDPLEFKPERWLPGGNNSEEELKNYDSTHSFGGGLRVSVFHIVFIAQINQHFPFCLTYCIIA